MDTTNFLSNVLITKVLWSLPIIGMQCARPVSRKYKKGNVAVYAFQGEEDFMEDRYAILNTKYDGRDISFFAIFDGHGDQSIAKYAAQNLLHYVNDYIVKRTKDFGLSGVTVEKTNYKQWLNEAISLFDNDLCNEAKKVKNNSGTTAIVALMTKYKLFVANLGDSRGIMCDHEDNLIALSVDQIEKTFDVIDPTDLLGRYTKRKRWNILGVYTLKTDGQYNAVPVIETFDFSVHKPKFLIFASRGLWETFDGPTAIQFIREKIKQKDPMYGAQSIAKEAYVKGSDHNITVMVINFSYPN